MLATRSRADGSPCKPGCMRRPGHSGACPINPSHDEPERTLLVEYVCGACGEVRGTYTSVEDAQEAASAHALDVHADRIRDGPGFEMETREAR